MEAEQDSAANNRRSNHPLGLALDGSTASTSFVYRSVGGGAASHTTTASSTVPTSTYFPISRHHVYSSPRKLQLDLNPRHVSRNSYRTRIIHHPHTQQQQQQQQLQQHGHVDANGTGSSGSSGGGSGSSSSHHRMRPYYVPERSRTKSENAVEACATVSQLFPELIGVQLATACVEDDDDDDTDGNDNATIAVPQLQLALNHMMDTSNDAELMTSSTTNTTNSSISNDQQHHLQLMMKMPTSQTMLSKNKSRSLEDVCRGARSADLGSQPSHEMEFMSTWIQNLKVKD